MLQKTNRMARPGREISLTTQPLTPASRATSGARVLVASDDAELRHRLAADLIESGLWLTAARSDMGTLADLDERAVDLVVLEWGRGRTELLARIRQRSTTPVIALVGPDDGAGALAAFDAGADDAIAWPGNPHDLERRIEALLRRSRPPQLAEDALDGPQQLRLRPRAHEVAVGEHPVELTPREFDVLRLLLERRGEVLSADQLSTNLWGHQTFGARNFVEAHISRLRTKLRAAGAGEVITTIRGVGYKIR